MALPPGPRAPALLQLVWLFRRPMEFFDGCTRRYGSAATMNFAGFGRVVWVADPQIVKELFASPDVAHAGEAAKVIESLVGPNSVLTLDGPEHMRQRKLLLPPFHGERIKLYEQVIAEVTERHVADWPRGTAFALRPRTQDLTLEVILRTVFGISARERLAEFTRAMKGVSALANMLALPEWMRRDLGRYSPWGLVVRRRAALDRLIYEEIEARRAAAPGKDDDVLSLLLEARGENGEPMSDEEIRDELVSIVAAGHETTATGLAWAFDLLLHSPATYERARSGDREYLEAVVKETLRLRPPVFSAGRIMQGPYELGPYSVPAGWRVWAPILVLQRDPDLFPQPHEFRPERWLGDGAPQPYSYIPFGGGIRRCIGAAFASLEMRVVIERVLSQLDLEAARPGLESATVHGVTLVPKRGTRVVARERARRAPGVSDSAAVAA